LDWELKTLLRHRYVGKLKFGIVIPSSHQKFFKY
jgi:hypothetical protein